MDDWTWLHYVIVVYIVITSVCQCQSIVAYRLPVIVTKMHLLETKE